jgi:uncharacterized ParB-like nuclease family protein
MADAWCALCETDIEASEVDPVRVDLVSQDEEWEMYYFAHSCCLREDGPRIVREYVARWPVEGHS